MGVGEEKEAGKGLRTIGNMIDVLVTDVGTAVLDEKEDFQKVTLHQRQLCFRYASCSASWCEFWRQGLKREDYNRAD